MSFPKISDAAFHGLIGEIVKKIDPYTEASPAAILLQLLVTFGAYVRRGPHFIVASDRHYARLFVVIVGPSATGRKGTSWGHVQEIFQQIDPEWFRASFRNGMSSGEGIISQFVEVHPKTGVARPIPDRQLLIFESEFARVLLNFRRLGNNLSTILRSAWDDQPLSSLTKNSMVADDTHVCIIGHITKEELRRTLIGVERSNGFANRFLYAYVNRSKELSFGDRMPSFRIAHLISSLKTAGEWARQQREITFSARCKEVWPHLVVPSEGLSESIRPLLSRTESQLKRVALTYALADRKNEIDLPHVAAAMAVIKFCEESTALIFERQSPLIERIWRILDAKDAALSLTNLNASLGHNFARTEIETALRILERDSIIRIDPGPPKARGRPTTLITLLRPFMELSAPTDAFSSNENENKN